MRLGGRRESGNIEDRRGTRITGAGGIGGVGVLLLMLAGWYFGFDPSVILENAPATRVSTEQVPYEESENEARVRQIVAVVLADTEQAWNERFAAAGSKYEEPTLVLFSGAVESGCGVAEAAVGPFYCPLDRKLYIDLSFYDDLQQRFGAPGDFAQAYVIAHEVGHHVQNLLGTSERAQAAQRRASGTDANRISVAVELQADCFAGIWAHDADRSRQLLEAGDVEEALNAASAIGDDRLQQQSQGRVNPESVTHGSSEQRTQWFRKGLDSGSVEACDTFRS
jgi:uncharacterized protein